MAKKKRTPSRHAATGPVTTAGPIADAKSALDAHETKEAKQTRLHQARRDTPKKD